MFVYSKCRYATSVTQASLVAQLVKNLPAMQDIPVRFLGGEDPWRRAQNPLQDSCLEYTTDRGAWQLQSMGGKESDTAE